MFHFVVHLRPLYIWQYTSEGNAPLHLLCIEDTVHIKDVKKRSYTNRGLPKRVEVR